MSTVCVYVCIRVVKLMLVVQDSEIKVVFGFYLLNKPEAL